MLLNPLSPIVLSGAGSDGSFSLSGVPPARSHGRSAFQPRLGVILDLPRFCPVGRPRGGNHSTNGGGGRRDLHSGNIRDGVIVQDLASRQDLLPILWRSEPDVAEALALLQRYPF